MNGQTGSRKRIVVGVDGSEASLEALRTARDLARLKDCSIEAVTAWHHPVMVADFPAVQWDPEVDARRILARAVQEAFGGDVPPDLRQTVTEGQAARVLADASRGAEMLVVGSRGRGGFTGLLLGSVSSAVASHARCPVLIVHDRERDSR
ncbi:universal stress protein [Arthrobacter mobilis]|uniref:Universal stress protein n=1 Tax=Arthrobacter mobilis TaxID=2724944 RepID=A0A7X6K358_9MICC|nr:universal stress protein [Arthrobacter mobilis]NKX53140.1 universal stress protein [Arthrobacter mobilis]